MNPKTTPLFPHPENLHDRLTADLDAWSSCQFAGIQPGIRNDEYFEMRQCPACQSTVLRRCSKSHAQKVISSEYAMLSRTQELLR